MENPPMAFMKPERTQCLGGFLRVWALGPLSGYVGQEVVRTGSDGSCVLDEI